MVLKRKLPTQESKKDKVVETEKQFDDFDMSIDAEEQAKVKQAEEGHDLNDAFPDQVEDKPEDFIPAELRALEDASPIASDESVEKPVKQEEQKFESVEQVMENEELKQEQETQDIAPVIFDEPETNVLSEEPALADEGFEQFTNSDAAPAELPTSQDLPDEDSFESVETAIEEPISAPVEESFEASAPVMEESFESPLTPEVEFENHEHQDWQEVTKEAEKKEHVEQSFDSFESVSWDNTAETVEVKTEISDERFNETKEDDLNTDPFGSDNGGIIPEIPGLDDSFSKPAEVMGENSSELKLNDDAKKKLVGGVLVGALVVGGLFVYSNMDTTTEVANRWSGALTEANQDIAETKQEQEELIKDGVDVTKTENVIDFSELDSEDDSDFSMDATSNKEVDPATEINLLEPEVIEKTASGKEVIKATGEEEIPDDVEEGANLITNITAEIEKQKAAQKGLDTLDSEESNGEKSTDETSYEGDTAEINKKVDEQLAEYRKLLAHEEDPGKKVKPGKFFSGKYNEENDLDSEPSSANVSKVQLDTSEYAASAQQIGGHNIIEYPQGVARKPDNGIRTLDHFRSLIIEKEDKRVRMPKGVKPGLKDEGFPKFKVISIVPNYGLIGQYNNTKGILMIGDSFKGWELVGVYESYAEFKSDTRKHIISLK